MLVLCQVTLLLNPFLIPPSENCVVDCGQDKTVQDRLICRVRAIIVSYFSLSFLFAILALKVRYLYVKVSASCYCNSLEFDNAERPECNNLLSVYQIVSGKTKEVWKKKKLIILVADALGHDNHLKM